MTSRRLPRRSVPASRINTVVVCALTTNKALAKAPGNTRLSRRATGLPRDSIVNASQIATVNKSDLCKLAGALPRAVMDRVEDGLRWFLAPDQEERTSH